MYTHTVHEVFDLLEKRDRFLEHARKHIDSWPTDKVYTASDREVIQELYKESSDIFSRLRRIYRK